MSIMAFHQRPIERVKAAQVGNRMDAMMWSSAETEGQFQTASVLFHIAVICHTSTIQAHQHRAPQEQDRLGYH